MDTDLPAHPDDDPAALRRYRELAARLSDRSALTDEAFDLLVVLLAVTASYRTARQWGR